MHRRSRICFVLAILWMAVIFMLSSRPADLSTQDSNFVSLAILHVTVPDFETRPMEEQAALIQAMEYPVRKAAHMTEYAILAMLWAGTFLPSGCAGISGDSGISRKTDVSEDSGVSGKAGIPKDSGIPRYSGISKDSDVSGESTLFPKTAGISLLISMLYACPDEFHQHFVPGRSCEVRDVLIDTAGALIGILVLGILMHFHKRRRINGS